MRDSRTTRIVLGILLAVSVTLVALDLRGGGGPLDGIRQAAANVFGPIENAVSSALRPITRFFGGVGSGADKDARIAELEAQVRELEAAGGSADAKRRIAELDSLLRTAGAGQYRIVPARVIAAGPAQDFAWTVTLDAGTRDGIGTEMTVVAGAGLVGRVVGVTDRTATVVLLVDPTTTVGARLEGSGQIGFLSGTGREDVLDYELFDPLAPMKPGDRLVTFGSQAGKPYVPGVPIGEVVSVKGTPGQLTRKATVRPFVDVSTLDLVGVVVQPPRTDPRDAVLPPRPTTSPTPSPGSSASPGGAAPSASPSPSTTANAGGPATASVSPSSRGSQSTPSGGADGATAATG